MDDVIGQWVTWDQGGHHLEGYVIKDDKGRYFVSTDGVHHWSFTDLDTVQFPFRQQVI